MPGLRPWQLRLLHALDRARLHRLRARHPGLQLDPGVDARLAHAHYSLGPGAQLHIEAGVVTERRADGVRFLLGAGARVRIGAGTWLRSDLGRVVISVFENAELELGEECFLNGCHVSAKQSVRLGRRAWVGPGSRVFDSDQHDLDADRPERSAPVRLGDHVWVASDVTVLKGVEIGEHSIVAARSVVTRSIPPHVVAIGAPAEPRGPVGDRSRTR